MKRFQSTWVAVTAGAVLFVGCWASLGGSHPSTVAVPRFAAPAAPAAAAPAPRTGLLPDCDQVLPTAVDPAALLAQPSGSVAVHGIVGTPAPSVDLLARTSCNYHRGVGKAAQTLGQVNLSAFADPAAAESQRQRNLAVEQADPGCAAQPVTLGAARATLLTSPAATVLMTSYGRYTVTTTLPHGLFPPDEERDVVTDLTRRALATTIEAPPAPPAQPAPAAQAGQAAGPPATRLSPALAQR